MPIASCMTWEDRDAVCELLTDSCCTGLKSDPLYLKIQKFHAAKLVDHLESGGKLEDFKCRIRKTLLNTMVMPSNKLMYETLLASASSLLCIRHSYRTCTNTRCSWINILTKTRRQLIVGTWKSTFK